MKRIFWIIAVGVLFVAIVLLARNCTGSGGTEVNTEEAVYRDITETVGANGKIQPETEVKISSDVSGEIVELFVKEGDHVKKGDLLCRIKPDLYESAYDRASATVSSTRASMENAEAQLEQAKANLLNSEAIYARQKKLFDQQVVSQQDYDASKATFESNKAQVKALEESVKSASFNITGMQASLKEASTNLAKTFIYAPVNATVSKLNKKKGERVVGTATMEGTEIMRLADLNEMEVNVDVSENDIIRVHKNDTALIEVDAYRDRKFKGLVTEVANSANTTGINADQVTNYTVKIRMLHESYASLITASNPVAFRPGMSATVELLTAHKNHVLTVPIQAVTLRIDSTEIAKGISKDVSNKKNSKNISAKTESKKAETCLFIMKDNKAKIVFVKTGIQDNEFIEITDGLQLSQEVITAPYSAISKMLFAGCPVKKVDKDKIFQVEQK